MKIDCHMHTPLCGHAEGEPIEYVKVAHEKSVNLITFTCHCPMDHDNYDSPAIRMRYADFPQYLQKVNLAKEAASILGIEVLTGIEAEIFPEESVMKEMDNFLKSYPFDFILGSPHYFSSEDSKIPFNRYYQYLSDKNIKEPQEVIRTYIRDIIQGIKSKRYDSIAHFDMIRESISFSPSDFSKEIQECLLIAKQHAVSIEINTSGLGKKSQAIYPHETIFKMAIDMGNSFTLGSDAHKPSNVGRQFDEVIPVIKNLGVKELCYYKKRQQITITI